MDIDHHLVQLYWFFLGAVFADSLFLGKLLLLLAGILQETVHLLQSRPKSFLLVGLPNGPTTLLLRRKEALFGLVSSCSGIVGVGSCLKGVILDVLRFREVLHLMTFNVVEVLGSFLHAGLVETGIPHLRSCNEIRHKGTLVIIV